MIIEVSEWPSRSCNSLAIRSRSETVARCSTRALRSLSSAASRSRSACSIWVRPMIQMNTSGGPSPHSRCGSGTGENDTSTHNTTVNPMNQRSAIRRDSRTPAMAAA